MTDLLSAIKEALDECEGMWILPDDAADLAEVCEAACRRALGGEWLRVQQPVEYKATEAMGDG